MEGNFYIGSVKLIRASGLFASGPIGPIYRASDIVHDIIVFTWGLSLVPVFSRKGGQLALQNTTSAVWLWPVACPTILAAVLYIFTRELTLQLASVPDPWQSGGI